MQPNLNANYRAAMARNQQFRPVYRGAISDPFIADAAIRNFGFSGMGEGENSDVWASITDGLKKTVSLGGVNVPVWGLVAGGVALLFVFKKGR